MIPSGSVPQANDPTRVIALCRHWHHHGIGTWPDLFRDGRDRSYYRHALVTVGALLPDGAATDRMAELASPDAILSQAAFTSGLLASDTFSRWLDWAGAATLTEIDADTAAAFLIAEADLSASTAGRRASTLRQWLAWCTETLPPSFPVAVQHALAGVDLHSRSANKFDEAKVILARQLSISPKTLAIKTLTDRKNFGNRISEATRVAPDALILVGSQELDLDSVTRAYEGRALTRPPTLVMDGDGTHWTSRRVIVGDDRLADPFPISIARVSATAAVRPESASSEDILEAIELLLALADQPISVLDSVLGELPPRLRRICHQKRVSSTKQAHNRVAEALGQRPDLLLLVASSDLEDAIERAVDQATGVGGKQVRVLLALHEHDRFTVVESLHTRPENKRTATPEVPFREPSVSRHGTLSWKGASYLAWNERLLDYVFAADNTLEAVTRIAANPEELKRAVGDLETDADEIVEAFRQVFCSEVPRGRTLDRQLSLNWPVPSDEVPHFFGLLWMTCLVCWGFPRQNEGSFHSRLGETLGRGTQYKKLDEAWRELTNWLDQAAGYRRLELPDPDALRTRIGRSYFLAFPHGRDRLRLSEVLANAQLTGRYLPVPTTLTALVEHRKRFSSDFQSDLEEFRKRWANGSDPAKSAFWRAVQQEAISPSHSASAAKPTAILIAREEDELIQLLLAWTRGQALPRGMDAEDDDDIDDLQASILVDSSNDPAATANAQVATPTLLDLPTTTAIGQGVLLFFEVDDWEYRLISGDVCETSVALVREEVAPAFLEAYGGRLEPAAVPGWTAVREPSVKAAIQPPEGLSGVDQLSISTAPPRPRFSGGIRVPGGHLWTKDTPPEIRAVGAVGVEAEFDGRCLPCVDSGDGLWRLPKGLVEDAGLPADLEARARWTMEGPLGVALSRDGTARTRLWRTVIDWKYKPAPGDQTHYWLEGVEPPMQTVTGGTPIDLGLTTRDRADAADLLEFDSSRRFHGPGCGELSARQQAGFDWLAIGGWKNPDWVIYVGDPHSPTGQDNGYSKVSGDRTHWRRCFMVSRDRVKVRTSEGYEPLVDHALVADEFQRRQTAIRQRRTPTIPREVTTDPVLRSLHRSHQSNKSKNSSTPLWHAIDHVAAIAQRRRGISGKEFQRIVLGLLKSDNYLLANQVRRAWAEVGAVDILHRQDRGQIVVVARRPRFLLVQDGPRILGLLTGLVPAVLERRLRSAAKAATLEYEHRPRVCHTWTPPLPLVWADSTAVLRTLSERLELADPMWMTWPTKGLPTHLNATTVDAYRHDVPPDYKVDAIWDWTLGRFSRSLPTASPSGMLVERRRHPLRPPVFVLRHGEAILGWSQSRNWALLEAWRSRSGSPFTVGNDGKLVSAGEAPVHLPLPLARACAILGDACPGPVPQRQRKIEYHYPLGPAVWSTFQQLLPDHWAANESL